MIDFINQSFNRLSKDLEENIMNKINTILSIFHNMNQIFVKN